MGGLPQSLGMYLKAGFRAAARFPDDRTSVPRVNLRLELDLS